MGGGGGGAKKESVKVVKSDDPMGDRLCIKCLSLYHVIQAFNDPKKKKLFKTMWERRKCW